jgi:hypothetical protein
MEIHINYATLRNTVKLIELKFPRNMSLLGLETKSHSAGEDQ